MIEFLGTRLLKSFPHDQQQASLGELCSVSDARSKELVEALMQGKKNSFVSEFKELAPGMGPANVQAFSITKLLSETELDTDTPSEILLVGILIGRIYAEVEAQSTQATLRLTKMLALMQKDPAKALRKMTKDIAKAVKKEKLGKQPQ